MATSWPRFAASRTNVSLTVPRSRSGQPPVETKKGPTICHEDRRPSGSPRGKATSVHSHTRAGRRADGAPVVFENRPERLVVVLAIPIERPPQHPFLDGAKLPERAVASTVPHGRARLHPVDADGLERELEH